MGWCGGGHCSLVAAGLAYPHETRLFAEAQIKTDKIDERAPALR
jgi:hypothetical protein